MYRDKHEQSTREQTTREQRYLAEWEVFNSCVSDDVTFVGDDVTFVGDGVTRVNKQTINQRTITPREFAEFGRCLIALHEAVNKSLLNKLSTKAY